MLYVAMNNKSVRERDGFKAIEFPFPSHAANLADISLTKRYPESGFAVNDVVSHFVYVISGRVLLMRKEPVDNVQGFDLRAGDGAYIEPGTGYYWVPLPEVRLAVFCTPSWTAEQHRTISE